MNVDDEHTPRVSLGVPVYNGEMYLREALDALLSQTFDDFEVILSDNASTDSTQEIGREYACRDQRVRYKRQEENLGAAANFNHCVDLARGEYFKWAAHDDVVGPHFLEACVAALDQDEGGEIVIVQPRAFLMDAAGNVYRDDPDEIACDDDRPSHRLAQLLRGVRAGTALYGLMRRERLLETRLHGRFLASDFVLLAELALRGRIVVADDLGDEAAFFRRVHGNMSMRAAGSKRQRLAWFDPHVVRSGRLLPNKVKLSIEFARAVFMAPTTTAERLAAVATIPRVYWPRQLRVWAGRQKQRWFAGLR